MKQNKLITNQLFEGSRFILPQHKEAIFEFRDSQKKRIPPVRDQQLLEELSRAIATALFCELPVEVTIFCPYQDKRLAGKIERLDKQQRLLRILNGQDEYELVPLDDIIKIELQNQSEMF